MKKKITCPGCGAVYNIPINKHSSLKLNLSLTLSKIGVLNRNNLELWTMTKYSTSND